MATSNASRLLLKILILIHLIGNTQQRVRLKTASQVSSRQQQLQQLQTTATTTNNNNNSMPTLLRSSLAGQQQAMATTISGYKCANHCSCSLIQVISSSKLESRANLTKVVCASAQFSDVLTIDRRTQIIHIILPPEVDNNQPQAQPQPDSKQVAPTLLSDPTDEQQMEQQQQLQQAKFRMPRLAQFGQLREIVIDNLKFELCDSEVFKRGQRLRRLQWNGNQLKRISKACFRYLDHLIDLNLDHNQLAELESALFSDLLSLRSLSIAHNRLTELAAHQFANLTNLVSLNLVGNSFKVINLHLLEPMQSSLRLLLLSSNEIRSFTYTIIQPPSQLTTPLQQATNNNNNNNNNNKTTITFHTINPGKASNGSSGSSSSSSAANLSLVFSGAIFKNLVKLNVDQNRFERIKLMQLHRFYNVKFLSIRANSIASIRDKAFNGLKLVELNLAANQLQSISRCAFCNATIKRLILSHNNLTLATGGGVGGPLLPAASALSSDQSGGGQLAAGAASELTATAPPLPPASSASMLILSQSLFGPLFGQLEYLDLSDNPRLADQLEWLLEPLLELRYLNLAAVGLERSLPSPSLFKNLRHLRYLNLSRNQLDQLISETVEPLGELEVLDLSSNKFSELDESLLVTLDDLVQLKLVSFASNPWYCSQCKISPLYDWMLRSPIYNATCIAPLAAASSSASASPSSSSSSSSSFLQSDDEAVTEEAPDRYRGGGHADLGLLTLADDSDGAARSAGIDFDQILASAGNINDDNPQYQLIKPTALPDNLQYQQRRSGNNSNLKSKQLARLIKSLETSQDDQSIRQTLASLPTANKIIATNNLAAPSSPESPTAPDMINEYVIVSAGGGGASRASELLLSRWLSVADLCLRCEFPSELRAFHVHELSPADFKYCAGSAPRFSASEPKIGLTLAIVIIGALFCIIVAVIVIYRKKSNAYYPNELDNVTERLDANSQLGASGGGGGGKGQPVLSVSSDNEQNQYGDGTDYSSPPLSQSYESYSGNEDEEEEEEEEDEDDEEEDEEEELDEEEDEDENDYDDDDEDDRADDEDVGHHLEEVDEADEPMEHSESATTNNDKSLVINSNANLPAKVLANNNNNNKLGIVNNTATQQAPGLNSSSTGPTLSGALRQQSSGEPSRKSLERQQSSGGEHRSASGRRTASVVSGRNVGEQPPPPMASPEADESLSLHDQPARPTSTTIESHSGAAAHLSQTSPAELSASDLLQQDDHHHPQQGNHLNGHAPKLVQLANVAGSLQGSQNRARTRQDRRTRQADRPPEAHQSSLGRPLNNNNKGQSPSASIIGTGKAASRQVAHRQSSEHSTAGSVSFGPAFVEPARLSANSSSSPSTSSPGSRQRRRQRLAQASQTIVGEHAPTGNHRTRNHHHQVVGWRSGGGGGGGGSTESNSGGRPLATGRQAAAAAADGKLRQGHSAAQVRSESRAATLTTMSSPSSSSPGSRPSQQQQHRRAHLQVQPPAVLEAAPGDVAGRQAALRGMPARRQADLSTPEASAADDSLALDAQLADLPSDLDETDVENLLASGGGGGAVLMDDYLDVEQVASEEDDEDQDDGLQYPAGRRHELRPGGGGGGAMHESHSTHSALTQTGSRDFQD